jgi:hypothetical protein
MSDTMVLTLPYSDNRLGLLTSLPRTKQYNLPIEHFASLSNRGHGYWIGDSWT